MVQIGTIRCPSVLLEQKQRHAPMTANAGDRTRTSNLRDGTPSPYRIRSPSICTDRSLSRPQCKHTLRRVCEERENVEVFLYVPDIPSAERRVRRVTFTWNGRPNCRTTTSRMVLDRSSPFGTRRRETLS